MTCLGYLLLPVPYLHNFLAAWHQPALSSASQHLPHDLSHSMQALAATLVHACAHHASKQSAMHPTFHPAPQ